MTSLRFRASLALVLAAFTAACGDSGSGGPSYADSVSTADALEMADASSDAATWIAENLDFYGPSYGFAPGLPASFLSRPEVVASMARGRHLRPFDPARLDPRTALRAVGPQAVVDEGCTYTARGIWENNEYDPVDNNENGVADDMLYQYVCVEAGEGDEYYTYTWRVTIKEIEGALWGFSLRWRYIDRWDSGDGDFEVRTWEQETDVDLRSGSAESGQSYSFAYAERFDGENWTEGAGDSWNAFFDPVGTIALESALPDGDLTINGRRYYHQTDGENLSFEISTPTPLAYNAACALANDNPPFTAGILLGELNGSSGQASFQVTFTACGDTSTDVDGAYDEPVVVTAGR
jgi:hypothetical protein